VKSDPITIGFWSFTPFYSVAGCLALAELGRRGLLLPDRLPEGLPKLLKLSFI